jgi:DNA mismatch repair protein MutS
LAGMPISIVRRAEEVLKDLETTKGGVATSAVLASNGLHVADGIGHYDVGAQFIPSTRSYEWQTEEARLAAQRLEQAAGTPPDLDEIDMCAITPLDALNLLFLIQKKRRAQLIDVVTKHDNS